MCAYIIERFGNFHSQYREGTGGFQGSFDIFFYQVKLYYQEVKLEVGLLETCMLARNPRSLWYFR